MEMRLFGYTVLVTSLLLAACANDERDFEEAQQVNTADGYAEFLQRNPESVFAAEARETLVKLEFGTALDESSIESWKGFLEDHPESLQAVRAREELAILLWAEVIDGTYEGVAEDGSELKIDLEESDGSLLIKQLGYKFPDGVRASRVLMPSGQPFGTMRNGVLYFQFPVLTWLFPAKLAFYEGKLEADQGKLICTLERIDALSDEMQALTTQDIDLAGARDISDRMRQEYRFILDPVQ